MRERLGKILPLSGGNRLSYRENGFLGSRSRSGFFLFTAEFLSVRRVRVVLYLAIYRAIYEFNELSGTRVCDIYLR